MYGDNQAGGYSLLYQAFWLIVWCANNVGVTLINKMLFSIVDFPYPYALSAIHMAFNTIGAQMFFFSQRSSRPKALDTSQMKTIYLFSIIFSLNIAIGNVSIRYVSVNFNQVMRSLVPIVVMSIGLLFQNKSYSSQRKWAVIPIVFGVALATFGDMRYTAIGIFFTVCCVILAALKVVLSGQMLTGDLKLHPVDLIYKMAPLALVQLSLLSFLTGELDDIWANWNAYHQSGVFHMCFISGVLSFSLNICSFMANKVTSPLTLSIAANIKQVLMILLSTVYFATPVSFVNGIGIIIVLIGGSRYSLVSVMENNSLPTSATASSSSSSSSNPSSGTPTSLLNPSTSSSQLSQVIK